MAILNCIIGIIFVFLVAFLISNNKKKINWKTVIIGFLIQFIFAFAALKWSVGKYILSRISLGVQSVIDYAKEGISFIFGSLSNDGSIFAVNVLGVIIFISALVSVLYYLGVMQFVIKLIGGGLSVFICHLIFPPFLSVSEGMQHRKYIPDRHFHNVHSRHTYDIQIFSYNLQLYVIP